MASIVNRQYGAWMHIANLSLGTTAATPNGDSFDMTEFSDGGFYFSSTHGDHVLTFWNSIASSTGPYALVKTSTGGAVAVTAAAGGYVKFPAAASACRHVRLTASTSAAIQTIPAVFLKKT